MKILFLGEPESPNTVSWVEGLRDVGCEVILASARTDGSDGNIPIGNITLPPRIRILTGVRHLKKIIAEIKPDILLAYRVTSYGYLAARTGFHPLVLAAQNEQIVYLPKPSRIRRKLLEQCAKFAIKNADMIHSWGDNITQGLLKFGADESKIMTLHRGIDMEVFSSVIGEVEATATQQHRNTASLHYCTTEPHFLSTRSLAPEYLIDKLLDAFKIVLEKIPNAKLEIAGGGSEMPALKRQVDLLGLVDNVTFHGRVDKTQMINLLHSSDIYVSIIQTEGISSSLIEGISCSLLPIVSDMSASRQIIENNVNGFLLKDISTEALAAVLMNAVNSYEKMKPALEENSQKIMQKFNRKKNQQIFLEKYRELLG
jgi:glycosyltransferase involved in cell wall biosynthesis